MNVFILTFFLGAAIGSFVNVMIDRTVEGEDWVRGRSHCDGCGKLLAWYDLIPIFSFVVYRGKSRCCNTPLTYRYPLVELLMGCLFVWWMGIGFWFFQLSQQPFAVIQPAFWLVTGIIMIILALADLLHGVVLMPIVYLGYASLLSYRVLLLIFGMYQIEDLVKAIVTAIMAAAFFGLLNRITNGRGMAEGDIYVAAYVGLVLGWSRGWLALGGSFVLGALIGLILMGLRIKKRQDTLPFVPYMMLAMGLVLVWGEDFIRFLS